MKIRYTSKPTGLDAFDTSIIYEKDSIRGHFMKNTDKRIQLKFGEVYDVNRMNMESYVVYVDGGEVLIHKSSAESL